MLCDMCGKNESSVSALIEGTELNVCDACSKFGRVLRKVKRAEPLITAKKTEIQKESEEEIFETIVKGYGNLVKEAREKLGLKQEDFAKRINEKVSVVHSIESEHHEPNIELARKLERFLKIKLVQKEKVEKKSFSKSSSDKLTIGDLIKIK